MRRGYVVVGVVVLVLAGALIEVPLLPEASVTVTSTSYYQANITGYSPLGTIPGTLVWSSPSDVRATFETCTAVSGDTCTGSSTGSVQNHSSGGTFSFSVPGGGAIRFLVSGGNASVSVKLAEATAGTLLLGVGLLFLVLGLVWRRQKPPALPTGPPSAPSPPPST